MRWVVLLATLVWLLSAAPPVGGQEGVPDATVQALSVSILPEAHDHRLWIILEALVDQPGTVALALPPAVELSRAIALTDEGESVPLATTYEAASDGRFVRFQTPGQTVRLEMYQDALPRQVTERTLTFTLPAQRYDLAALRWRVLFPNDATELQAEPPMMVRGLTDQGQAEWWREAGPLLAGTPATQRLRWTRPAPLVLQPSGVVPETPLRFSEPAPPLPWIELVALLLLGGAITVHGLWRARRGKEERAKENATP